MIGIYKITSPSNRVYIGQTTDYVTRLHSYKNLKCKKQIRIYRSLKKYSVDNHTFEFIEKCDNSQLNNRERYWQEYYNVIGPNGLNCRLTKSDDKSGKLSNSIIKKMSKAQKGKPKSKEFIERLRKINTGKKQSEHTKLLISINHTRKKKVICTKTKQTWNSVIECCNELNINSKTLSNKLSGKRKNNTTLTFLKNE